MWANLIRKLMRKIIRNKIRKKGGKVKEKQVTITVSASGQVKELALSPGATVQEVLDEAGLQDYQLSIEGGEPFPLDADLYSLV